MVAVIGENMNIRRFERISTDGIIVPYIHAGGKIGVLVEAGTDSASDGVKECLKNIAMQIAALNPKYLSSDDVDEEYKEHEKGILLTQAKNDPKNEGKPDDIIEEEYENNSSLQQQMSTKIVRKAQRTSSFNRKTALTYNVSTSVKVGAFLHQVVLKHQSVEIMSGPMVSLKRKMMRESITSLSL